MKLGRTNKAARGESARLKFDRKLAAYLAASAGVAQGLATDAAAVVVSNNTVQPFGINEHVNIDFNSDGQIDFQIDHDRVDLDPGPGTNYVDYLQLDKNDVSSAENPYAINPVAPFPLNGTPRPNGDHHYMTDASFGDIGFYPKALTAGTEIGPTSGNEGWELFQEGDGFGQGGNGIIHANRLIDEDMGQVDAANPNPPAGKEPVVPFGSPGWVGLGGETRYLGVKIDLVDEIYVGLNDEVENPNPAAYLHGWIGVRITNEADATGEVTGWGYETEPNVPILAGQLAAGLDGDFNGDDVVDAADYVAWRKTDGTPGGYNLFRDHFGESLAGAGGTTDSFVGGSGVPEPSSLFMALVTGAVLIGAFLQRRVRGQ